MPHPFKQVVVLRKDLNMRKGKMAAQAAHASMAGLFPRSGVTVTPAEDGLFAVSVLMSAEQLEWFEKLSVKIVVGVADEAGLLDVHQKAVAAGLPCALIQDAGFTEFGGVKTYTAVGIGPCAAEDVDAITGNLSLL